MSRLFLAAALTALACRAQDSPPLALRLEPGSRDTRLVLVAAPGFKIGARLKPALESPDGSVLRFDAGRLTPDSTYFAEPPVATMAGRHTTVRGTLRASICAEHERVCRSVAVAVSAAVYSPDAPPRPPESHRPLTPADPAQAHPPS